MSIYRRNPTSSKWLSVMWPCAKYILNRSGNLLKQRSYSTLDGLRWQVASILLKVGYLYYSSSMNPSKRNPFKILILVTARVILSGRTEVKSINEFFLFETSTNTNPVKRRPFRILGMAAARVNISSRTKVKSINEFFLFETSTNLLFLMSSSNFLAATLFIVWQSAAGSSYFFSDWVGMNIPIKIFTDP